MTILVALACDRGAAVAADRRQTQNGVASDDFTKTFAYTADYKRVIGGIAGQLMDGSIPMTDVISSLCAEALTLDDLVNRCVRALYQKVPPQNGIDLVLAAAADLTTQARPQLRHIVLLPCVGQRTQLECVVTIPPDWVVAGSGACPQVFELLGAGWSAATVGALVLRAVETAIEVAAGPAGDGSCGGSPSLEIWGTTA